MARPRVFVSSTYYDLRYIRENLQKFIAGMGYEPVLFESGDIPFRHDIPLDKSCYAEIHSSHMLVLIIGSRYGSQATDEMPDNVDTINKTYQFYNSVTKEEYLTARGRDIPIFIFVEKTVLSEYETFKKNRTAKNLNYAHVDNVNIFHLLDDILSQSRNNYVRPFDKFDDISEWLTEQWAGLFAEFLSRRAADATLNNLASQVSELGEVTTALKGYSEQIIQALKPNESGQIIAQQEEKIKQSRAADFVREPLVRHIAGTLKRHHISPSLLRTEKLYHTFDIATSLPDWMTLLGIPLELQIQLFSGFERVASNDFALLKRRYFKQATDEDAEFARLQAMTSSNIRPDHLLTRSPSVTAEPPARRKRPVASRKTLRVPRKNPAK